MAEAGTGTTRTITKVLVANRGEIAVRVARACADAGLASVAVYADPDRDALHVRTADEAFALGGSTPGESYLRQDKLLDVARRSGADAVHPGYGFLSENAEFAQAVVDAGLVWVGPPPSAIRALGDKVAARRIAEAAGAPLVAGTPDPVESAAEVLAFVDEHGLPVAIKAAHGGGGRGLKVVREREDVEAAYESAVREAVAAFGRGECFVERFLDRPRHVETQCLADEHGAVVVVSTRDCSLQRRNQKLVEEAPAPFLTDAQVAELYRASKEVLRTAGYVGAGTCEFLVAPDGTTSFLEVNTRLQVEHPVSEEVTGIDLVREQLRLAVGEPLGYDDPPVRGHSFEFRLNAEDAGRGFLPAPGKVRRLELPSGPGVRVDSGVVAGDVVSGQFDSMLGKLVVTGADRRQALERSRRALAELRVDGLPTVVPFHRAVVVDPAFAPEVTGGEGPFRVHTRWIETEYDNRVEPYDAAAVQPGAHHEREAVVVEVGGRRLEVVLPAGLGAVASGARGAVSGVAAGVAGRAKARRGRAQKTTASGAALTSPMQGTIVQVVAAEGDTVAAGDTVVVLEAMKMEQPLTAHRAGVVRHLTAAVGETVSAGAAVCEITDPAAPADTP